MKVKTIFLSLFLVGATLFLTSTKANAQRIEKLSAVYKGFTDDGLLKFVDDKKNTFLFSEIGDDVEIDISDDEFIGTKFKMTWEEDSYEIYDDEDEPTGTFEKFNRILTLEVAN